MILIALLLFVAAVARGVYSVVLGVRHRRALRGLAALHTGIGY